MGTCVCVCMRESLLPQETMSMGSFVCRRHRAFTHSAKQAEDLQKLQHSYCGEMTHQHTTQSPGSDCVCVKRKRRCVWCVCM